MAQLVHCSAPGRCGIIGNPTDMYGGSVISCSIPYRAQVTIEPSDHLEIVTAGEKLTIQGTRDLSLNGDYFDVARAVLDYLQDDALCCRITYWSDIPVKAGVSGSTALTVAILYGLLCHKGISHDRYRIAELARYIELNHLRIVCGYQDAYMCTFGGINYMDFRDKQFYRQAEEELYATIEPLEQFVRDLPFVLAHTGVKHSSDAVHKPLRERWLEGDAAVRQGYEEIARLAREGKKGIVGPGLGAVGALDEPESCHPEGPGRVGRGERTVDQGGAESRRSGRQARGRWGWRDDYRPAPGPRVLGQRLSRVRERACLPALSGSWRAAGMR